MDQIQPLGIGELQLAFERLKQKLDAEGLFDAEHKKPIPEFPECIGLVTSETGAALQDIRSVLSRRHPSVEVVLAPVRVQGAGAAEEIADAINQMNQFGGIDVLIVGRGGGSLEDLWAFNEEIVARAIYASKIPIMSAVGHEIDFSIADFAADLRAPTPSAAAELVVRDRSEFLEDIGNLCYTMRGALDKQVSGFRERTASLVTSYSFNRPKDLVREFSQRVDELERSLGISYAHNAQIVHQKYDSLQQQLQALNPGGVLKRGYAIVRKEGRIVSSAGLLGYGDEADIQFHDGTVGVKVEKGHSIMTAKKAVKNSLENSLQRLEEIVETLERGDASLDDAVTYVRRRRSDFKKLRRKTESRRTENKKIIKRDRRAIYTERV